MRAPLNIRIVLTALAIALCGAVASAQDIAGFRIQERDNIFARETESSLAVSPTVDNFPVLDCAIEYIRRQDGKDIVYRRGPISLHQRGLNRPELTPLTSGTQPASEVSDASKPYFTGGIIVDLPKTGEASDHLSQQADYRYYMLRVSLIPQSYKDGVLSNRILLERSIVTIDGDIVQVLNSEVFSHSIEIKGNEPLNFTLPAWEKEDDQHHPLIPKSLEEALLVTLETPRFYAFSENYPEPFSTSTRIQYSVPVSSTISLTIRTDDKDKIIDAGHREPGTYQVLLDGAGLPEGRLRANLVATTDEGTPLHDGSLEITKSKDAPEFSPPHYTASAPSFLERFALSLESGFAYQFPVDQAKSMRNMFTHIAFRLGYRVSSFLELGAFGAQDAFHEHPGPEVDTARIADYGGVVGYVYGSFGVYSRMVFGSRSLQPLAQMSVGFTNTAAISDIGIGVRAYVFSRLQLTVLPTVTMHWKNEVSTKIGIQYGMMLRF
jgi:hypothetical protein